MDVNSRDPLQNIIPFRVKGVEIGRFDSSGNLKIGTTTTTAPTVRLDISGGEARVNSGSATSTAITTTGRIGVNTAAPTADLDVSGAARVSASSATATALTTVGRIGVNTATPTVDLDVSGAARVSASSAASTAFTTTGRIGINVAAPAVDLDVSGAARVTASSSTATVLTMTGRVGVNTASPTAALDVSGAAYLNSGSGSGSVALWTLGRVGVNNTAPGFDLDVNGRACVTASSATATALTTTGRIGVNTAAPGVALDVSGEGNILTGLTIGSSTVAGLSQKLSIYHSSDARIMLRGGADINNGLLIGNSPSNSFITYQNPLGEFVLNCEQNRPMKFKTTNTDRMTILGDGKVGIGTTSPTADLEVNGIAKIGNVTIGANPLYAFTSHTFDNANATGRLGPTLSACRTRYQTSAPTATWAQDITNNYLNMTNNGIQLWTVPVTGTYLIRAVGAGGGGNNFTSNGKGRIIQTTTTLLKGEVIRILVGQQGTYSDPYVISPAYNTGAGGGGTFVVRGTDTPIIVAGGGGGTGYMNQNFVNNNANLGTSGNNSDQAIGGTNGQGGMGSGDGGGGGMFGNGGGNGSEGGLSFINGGLGGIGDPASSINGGFGGGGGGSSSDGGGGGGGYSGGGGGGGGVSSRGGGGGGSFAISEMTDFDAINTGHGSVTITLLSPSSDFDVAGVSRMSASSATATALTTVGRIGVNTATPTTDLDVVGNAAISGAMTISGCKPRIAVNVSSSPGINVSFNIPPALRSGDLIANKVYFAIRVPALSSNPALFLRPNGSATVFHSFTQQFTGSAPVFAGDSPTQGFRICNILNNGASGGSPYVAPSYINIVGEFTIIRDMLRVNSTTNNPSALTTRLYGTLVQYGNHYMQKWDFQGQAVGGGNYDIYERIDNFYFTSATSYGSDTSVSVKIEGD